MSLDIVRDGTELAHKLAPWRTHGQRIALVPTMGALHHGHVSLVEVAKRQADRCVVSLFVNPKQFGADEDFTAYPRDETRDAALLAEAGADLLYAPAPEAIYPPGFQTLVRVQSIAEGMEGDHRLNHFDGVATVVAKLILQSRAHMAVFGEKDYQQLQLIRQMARDLDLGCTIVGAPVVRETDGLAASSRNAYLTPTQRSVAPMLYQTLMALAEALPAAPCAQALLEQGRQSLLRAGFDRVDYLDLRDAETLVPLDCVERPARLLCTARLGRTRLLDNVAVAPLR